MKVFRTLQIFIAAAMAAIPGVEGQAQCTGIDFTGSEVQVCAPKSVRFFTSNIPAGSTIEWNYGGGFVPGKDTGQFIFSSPGSFTITLKVTLSDGVTECIVSKPGYITVYPAPVPLFTVSRPVLCNGPDTVTITDKSIGATSRNWTVDGLPIADTSVQFVYNFTSTGYKSILLSLSSPNCPTTYYNVDSAVRVYNPLDFDFTADTTKGCVPINIKFSATNITAGHVAGQYDWSFGGGTPVTSTQANPTIQYATAGTYSVTLKITNTDGCAHQVGKNSYIVLGDSTAFSVVPSKTTGCRGEEFILNISNPMLPGSFSWELGNAVTQAGSTPVSQRVIFHDTGFVTYKVTRDYNGCISEGGYNKQVYINPPLANFLVLNPVECDSNARVYLFNTSRLAPGAAHTYFWRFYGPYGTIEATSTDSIPVFYTSRYALYSLELVVHSSNGCSDSMFQTNNIVRRKGVANFVVTPEVGCTGRPVKFNSTSVPFSSGEPNVYDWTIFGKDGVTILKHQNSGAFPEISYTFGDTGTFKVSLRVYNSKCSDTFLTGTPVRIIKPNTSFSVSNILPCVDNTVSISASSQPDIAPLTYTYKWLVQNSADTSIKYPGTGPAINIKMDKPGNYNLYLTTAWANGCYDSINNPGYIKVSGPVINAGFSNPTSCVPLIGTASSVLVQDYNYINPANTTITYNWISQPTNGVVFANPNAATTQVTFNQTGQFNLLLIATNGSGCTDTFASSSPVYSGVQANFSTDKNTICTGDTGAIINLAGLLPTGYQWVSIPPGVVFLPNPSVPAPKINFPDSGTYIIRQIVTKNNVCYDTAEQQVSSVQVIADFNTPDTNKYCAPASVTFTNNSINADSLFWQLGDGRRVSTGNIPQLQYVYLKNSGPVGFDVRVTAKNNIGCYHTLDRTSYVTILGPVPGFSVNTDVGCNPLTVTFTDTSKYYSQYYFDYGDGSTFDSTGNPGTHTYENADALSEAKQYKPKVFLLDPQGCLAEYQYPGLIRVNNPPQLAYSGFPTSGCIPVTVRFSDSSQYATSWSWDFDGDGIEDSKLAKPSHTYKTAGQYTVIIKAISQYGCESVDTLVDFVAAYGIPVASFNLQRVEGDTTNIYYDFINQSQNFASLQWYLDSTFIGNSPTFRYGFKDTGYQKIRLVAVSANNCSDTTDSTIFIYPDYFFHVPNAFTPNHKGGNETFGLFAPPWAKRFSMRIYNRYGELLFETQRADEGWDGSFKEKPCQEGVYLYSIEYLDILSHWHVFQGTVLLLR